VEDTDAALAATEEAVRRFHDPSPGAMVRVAAAPCSPFSVSPRLMRETADLARGLGVRMHTHLAETREEVAYCRKALGCTPAEYAEDLGWLGPDVWLAHCVHLDEAAVRRFAAGMFSAAVTAADRSVSRSVMAATNCLVSASLGFFSATCRNVCSAPAMRADSCAPYPENWPS